VCKEQQRAFDVLKQAISQPPVLKMADFSEQFIVQTDASGVALGAVLSQEVDGVRQPIAYASRTLSAQERKAASTYELECLAVLFAMDKFRKYLEHQAFVLETDNRGFGETNIYQIRFCFAGSAGGVLALLGVCIFFWYVSNKLLVVPAFVCISRLFMYCVCLGY
jgi:hypothetical protein